MDFLLLYQEKNTTTKKEIVKDQRIGGVSNQSGKFVGLENYNLQLIS